MGCGASTPAAADGAKPEKAAGGGDTAGSPGAASFFKLVDKVKKQHPDNLCAKYLDKKYYATLEGADRDTFYKCVRTGIDNPDSGMGCYAMTPGDLTKFKPFFGKVIGDYHKKDPKCALKHVNDWDASGVGEGGVLDLQKLGMTEPISMRVRVGRNLAAFNLPGAMDKAERIKFEQTMLPAFDKLIKTEGYGGKVYSITPDFGADGANPNFIDDAKYQELVKKHVMFKDMDADPYLKSAGISSDWPYGRGCWMSDDEQKIIWIGEEDHLRIMVMKKGFLINEVFSELKTMLDLVETLEVCKFAKDEQYGYITSCPTNLGTGMRASVHVKVPNLTKDGTDKRAKEVAGPLGLSVRGTGGEHTPIGADGTVDISPRARLFITEAQIVEALYKGVDLLMKAEEAAGKEPAPPPAAEKPADAPPAATATANSPEADDFFKLVDKVKADQPDNLCAKYLEKDYYASLTGADRDTFYKCVRTGIDNPDSGMGCYAMTPGDLTKFKPFFGKVIGDYHKKDPACAEMHVNDWDASGVGEGGVLDLQKLGMEEPISMRVRVGRNLAAFNLPGAMDKAERIKFEQAMLPAFDKLIATEGYGGKVYSITPDFGADGANPNFIDDAKYQELVKKHVMFKDMDADPYLKSAGISSDWPFGRGCWMSDDEQKIIWIGEEDHLRIMVMKKGSLINEVFSELKTMLDLVETLEVCKFAKDEQYGYITSCPTNLGTGMRASVHVKIPNLTSDGTDAKAKEVAGPLGLSVRGTGGEHTPIGADGTVDISPRARLFIKECEIVEALYNGVKLLMEAEAAAGAA